MSSGTAIERALTFKPKMIRLLGFRTGPRGCIIVWFLAEPVREQSEDLPKHHHIGAHQQVEGARGLRQQ